MTKKVNLIRTMKYSPSDNEDYYHAEPKIGLRYTMPKEEIARRREAEDGEPSLDSAIIAPRDGGLIYNVSPDTAFSAVGYSDPKYSLYPLVSVDKWYGNGGILLDDTYDIDFDAFPDIIKDVLVHSKNKREAAGILKNWLHHNYKQYTGQENYDSDDMYDIGMTKLLAEMGNGIRDKAKYKRLLKGLRGYSINNGYNKTDRKANAEYDTPSIALIETPINNILTAKDKTYYDSAEQDGPEEYRTHDFTIKGLWSPRTVDSKLEKYYPGYTKSGSLYSMLRAYPEESRAKDAIADIISEDADRIISDAGYKKLKQKLSSSRRINSNIASALTTGDNRWR